jgi:hypothetical protein
LTSDGFSSKPVLFGLRRLILSGEDFVDVRVGGGFGDGHDDDLEGA